MAATRTLAQLRSDVRDWGAYQNSARFTDSVLTAYINSGVARAYKVIADARPDFYALDETLSTSASTGRAALSSLTSDIYRILRVDVDIGTLDYVRMREFEQIDRDQFEPHLEAETLRVIYVPEAPRLSADGDVFTYHGLRAAEELIIQVALRHCFAFEDRALGALERELLRVESEVRSEALSRNSPEPKTMSDFSEGAHPSLAYREVGAELHVVECGW